MATDSNEKKRTTRLKTSLCNNDTQEVLGSKSENTYTCDVCNEPFSRMSRLITHQGNHKTKTGNDVSVKVSANSLTDKENSDGLCNFQENCYICDVCKVSFRTKTQIRNHVLIHLGETRNFICKVCSKLFPTASLLASHKRSHSQKKFINCPFCKKSFSKYLDLKIHKLTHNSFSCKVCGKLFSKKASLNMHIGMMSHW